MTPEQLRETRKSLGLTQEDLAWVLKVSSRTIRRWEKGEIAAPGPVKVALAFMLIK